MSATAAWISTSFHTVDAANSAFSWGRYERIGLLTIGASVPANAVFFYLAQVAVQYEPAFLPLGNVSAPIIFTVFFVVTLIPDFTYVPTVDGVSNAEIAVLVMMHAIAAAVITRGLTSVRR